MKHLQQYRKFFLLVFGILMIASGIVATILALKMDTPPHIEESNPEELPE